MANINISAQTSSIPRKKVAQPKQEQKTDAQLKKLVLRTFIATMIAVGISLLIWYNGNSGIKTPAYQYAIGIAVATVAIYLWFITYKAASDDSS